MLLTPCQAPFVCTESPLSALLSAPRFCWRECSCGCAGDLIQLEKQPSENKWLVRFGFYFIFFKGVLFVLDRPVSDLLCCFLNSSARRAEERLLLVLLHISLHF